MQSGNRSLLLRGGLVITMDARIGDFISGDILIESGKISAVAPSIDAPDAEVIDARGRIVMPGLVDTHRHTWQSSLRHRLGDEDFLGYGCAMLRGMAPLYRPEDIYIGNLLGALSALDAGTTTLLDWSHALNTPGHADAAIDALAESRIRAVFAYGWSRNDNRNWTQNSQLGHPEDIGRIRKERLHSDSALVTLAMAARGPEMTSMEVVQSDFRFARELGIRMSMHAGVKVFADKYRAIEKMNGSRLLGPDLTLIHVCASSDDELRMMADNGVTASIGPQVEMNMSGAGIPALGRLLAAGVRPSLSGDTETAGSGDLFTQMKFAFSCEKLLSGNKLVSTPVPKVMVRNVLDYATLGGAEACGLQDRTGSLVPGKDADIIIVRADDLNLHPVTDPYGAIVLAAHPGNVESVLVRGEFRKRDGSLVGVDFDAVRRRARESRDWLLAASGV
ncbi:amidohydrolase family protein [Paraburkholderia aspalathi]|uniref:amidohydrolase family protein n=1 Tax=Paraburkholderia aspalathi TaxID=1324617 RepID=UPI003CB95988